MAEASDLGGPDAKDPDDAPAGGAGLLGMVLPPIVAGAAAFGVTYFMAGPSAVPAPVQADDSAVAVDRDDATKSKGAAKTQKETSTDYLLPLEPMVVSLARPDKPGLRAPRLRLVVAISGQDADPEKQGGNIPHIRDAFTRVIRSMTADELNTTGGLELLRTRLLAEAMDILGAEGVSAVLITDFIIT